MWANLQETADLVTFTEEILNRKLHFLYSEKSVLSESLFWNYLNVNTLVARKKHNITYLRKGWKQLTVFAKTFILIFDRVLNAPVG